MAKRSPGLTKRGATWHIDKHVHGYGRLAESCRTSDLAEAEAYLARRLAEIKAELAGARVEHTWAEACARYIDELRLAGKDAARQVAALDPTMPYIGTLPLQRVHAGTLQPWIMARLEAGMSRGTVNLEIGYVRRVLNLAARLWRDAQGRPWLDTAPLIPFVENHAPKRPYPLTWDEQMRLVRAIPVRWLQLAVIIGVNCGAREGELCALRWDWAVEREHAGRTYTLFVLPAAHTKTRTERVVVPNRAAQAALAELRGYEHPLVLLGHQKLSGPTWRKAWEAAGLPTGAGYRKGPHNLRHTYGHRLAAAGVSFQLTQELLGHSTRGVTERYTQAEIGAMIDASDAALETREAVPLRVIRPADPANVA